MAEDYWRGYKLFCFGYYSHSSQHVQEFRQSKLGARISSPHPVFVFVVQIAHLLGIWYMVFEGSAFLLRIAGELVWRRHADGTSPSPHAVRATCMGLLPLVELFLWRELQEDCSNLEGFLLRFDSEAELQSHELGRALLFMVRNDEEGLPASSPQLHREVPHHMVPDPFQAVRERLAAVDTAIRTLQPQVLPVIGYTIEFTFVENLLCTYRCSSVSWHPCNPVPPTACQLGCRVLIQIPGCVPIVPLFCHHSSMQRLCRMLAVALGHLSSMPILQSPCYILVGTCTLFLGFGFRHLGALHRRPHSKFATYLGPLSTCCFHVHLKNFRALLGIDTLCDTSVVVCYVFYFVPWFFLLCASSCPCVGRPAVCVCGRGHLCFSVSDYRVKSAKFFGVRCVACQLQCALAAWLLTLLIITV